MHPKFLPSFARTRVRGLRDRQKWLLAEFLPAVSVAAETNFAALFRAYKDVALEIGFGAGEHLCHRAKQEPDTLFLGCEVFEQGLASCLGQIENEALSNIRVFAHDARLLLEALPNNSLAAGYVLFPDPWPKTRHHKRRIVNRQTLDLLAAKIKPEGRLHLATDHPGYLEWMCVHLSQRRDFRFAATSRTDWETPPDGHVQTRYQEKNKAESGRSWFLNYVRI